MHMCVSVIAFGEFDSVKRQDCLLDPRRLRADHVRASGQGVRVTKGYGETSSRSNYESHYRFVRRRADHRRENL